ncbi:MAG: hypothetical protein QOF77_614 [Solirubrobacteraceae bacterium]|jgi:PleD family two-component response regulator|nr:hypothetical protein [Solirubrobacteraceae bacterium]
MGVAGRLLAATPHGLTASAGVSCWGTALTPDQLVALADRALYQAKRDGRDRVVLLASGPRPPRAG